MKTIILFFCLWITFLSCRKAAQERFEEATAEFLKNAETDDNLLHTWLCLPNNGFLPNDGSKGPKDWDTLTQYAVTYIRKFMDDSSKKFIGGNITDKKYFPCNNKVFHIQRQVPFYHNFFKDYDETDYEEFKTAGVYSWKTKDGYLYILVGGEMGYTTTSKNRYEIRRVVGKDASVESIGDTLVFYESDNVTKYGFVRIH